ncbi:endothelin-converting enzyme homolog [Hydractinia symbiolongicarpus]|uniref:endothelin-converting enzyme homolog n=1 Tax=Hydractinia symbiolongicarpus TaxID=13093 RepID=UPI00254BAA9F|nr:endothelin-converting enzyme homolog [Hydractinia symbiolongicarpus]
MELEKFIPNPKVSYVRFNTPKSKKTLRIRIGIVLFLLLIIAAVLLAFLLHKSNGKSNEIKSHGNKTIEDDGHNGTKIHEGDGHSGKTKDKEDGHSDTKTDKGDGHSGKKHHKGDGHSGKKTDKGDSHSGKKTDKGDSHSGKKTHKGDSHSGKKKDKEDGDSDTKTDKGDGRSGKKTHKGDGNKNFCNTTICKHVTSHFLSALDKSVNPCDDFYQYACGGWLSKNPIPNGKSEISTITQLQERLFKIEKSILENKKIATLDSEAKKNMFRLFESCMDVKGKNKLGTTPMATLLTKLGGFKTVTYSTYDYQKTSKINTLAKKVFKEASISPLFTFTVGPDLKRSTENIIQFGNPGSVFFEKETLKRVSHEEIMRMYKDLMQKLVKAFSDDMTYMESRLIASDIYNFELSLQQKIQTTKSSVSYYATTVSSLSSYMSTINWLDFLNSAFQGTGNRITSREKVVIINREYFKTLDSLFRIKSYNTIHNYMLIKVVLHYLDALPDNIVKLFTKLTTAISGPLKPRPQWQTCISVTDKHLGLALGAAFVQKVHFSKESHDEANRMVGDLRKAFKEILPSLTWLDSTTREAASEKIDAIVQQIGYPPYILNPQKLDKKYNGLKIVSSSYFDHILYLNRYKVLSMLKNLGKPVNRNTWLQTPATINAYYNPRSNHIAFPAAILQPPYFETDYPKAVNYGCIGSVIGHEMTHGFDNTGRWFDKYGNLRGRYNSWWTYSSVANFVDRSKCFVNQYSAVEVAGDYIKGKQTLGENIADNGGIQIAYKAYKDWEKENGTPPLLKGVADSNDQLFFLSYAQFFCSAKTDKALLNQLKTDVHSPNMERVRGTIQNNPEFAKAFNCPRGSKMNPYRKCKLW